MLDLSSEGPPLVGSWDRGKGSGYAKFWVRVIKREKRGSHCQEEQGLRKLLQELAKETGPCGSPARGPVPSFYVPRLFAASLPSTQGISNAR